MSGPALAIVGMRRSGTSSISQVLSRLGVSFGDPSQLFSADSFNEEGYWEHKALSAIHRKFRMSLDLGSVDCDPTPPDWFDRPWSKTLLEAGVRCLRESFLGSRGPWAWKDPDASLALPFVYEMSRRAGFEPHVLLAVRNPSDTARSDLRRTDTPEFETVGSWLAHTLTALHDSRSHPRSIVIFSEFLAQPRETLEPVVRSLGLNPSDGEWEQAVASIRPDLVHSNLGHGGLGSHPLLVQRTYSACTRAANGFDPDIEAELESCYAEFEGYRRLFLRRRLELATLGAMWGGGEKRHARSTYRPNGNWQVVSIETNAAPETPVELFLYPLPANVWIRKAVWRQGDKTIEALLEPGRSGKLSSLGELICVSLIHGTDQVIVRTPQEDGPFSLELELMVESNNLVIGDTYRVLSEAYRYRRS